MLAIDAAAAAVLVVIINAAKSPSDSIFPFQRHRRRPLRPCSSSSYCWRSVVVTSLVVLHPSRLRYARPRASHFHFYLVPVTLLPCTLYTNLVSFGSDLLSPSFSIYLSGLRILLSLTVVTLLLRYTRV